MTSNAPRLSKVVKTNQVVDFLEPGHLYVHRPSGRGMTPVTAWISRFAEKFDVEGKSASQARKFGAWPGFWRELWKNGGARASALGTDAHFEQETLGAEGEHLYLIDAAWDLPVFAEYDARKSPRDGIYLEMLLHSAADMLAGQSDRVVLMGGKSYVSDFKRAKDLSKTGTYKRMAAPFSRLPDNPYGKYCIQLSAYAYFIKRAWGHEPHGLELIKLKHGGHELIPCEDVTDIVARLLA